MIRHNDDNTTALWYEMTAVDPALEQLNDAYLSPPPELWEDEAQEIIKAPFPEQLNVECAKNPEALALEDVLSGVIQEDVLLFDFDGLGATESAQAEQEMEFPELLKRC